MVQCVKPWSALPVILWSTTHLPLPVHQIDNSQRDKCVYRTNATSVRTTCILPETSASTEEFLLLAHAAFRVSKGTSCRIHPSHRLFVVRLVSLTLANQFV